MTNILRVEATKNGTAINAEARNTFSSIISTKVGSTPTFNPYAIGEPISAERQALLSSEVIILV